MLGVGVYCCVCFVGGYMLYMYMYLIWVSWYLNVLCGCVYCVLFDFYVVEQWKVFDGMICCVYVYDVCEGGVLCVLLSYDVFVVGIGKIIVYIDIYYGCFVMFVLDQQIVEIDVFEIDDLLLCGVMMIMIMLFDEVGGMCVDVVYDGVLFGVLVVDNEIGWQMVLVWFVVLVEVG